MVQQLHIHFPVSGMEAGTTLYRVLQTRDDLFHLLRLGTAVVLEGERDGGGVLGLPHTGHSLAMMLPVFPMVLEFAGWTTEQESLSYVYLVD